MTSYHGHTRKEMTGRDLIKFILNTHMENATIVFENERDEFEAWHYMEKKHLVVGNGILIIKHPEVKRKRINDRKRIR